MPIMTAPEPRNKKRLEKRVGKEMEHRCVIGADAGGKKHVSELGTGGVSDDLFDVVL